MECILLGSGGMMPMPERLLTSLLVRVEGRMYLFDAGEGTQIGLKRARSGIKALRVLAVSHMHADHCLGIPGILMMRAQVPDPGPLTLLGPPGIRHLLTQIHRSVEFHLNYPIKYVEWQQGASEEAYSDEAVRIFWAPLKHTALCLGYRLEEHPRPGTFRIAAAESLGIPKGPLWGALQRGETVTLPDGTLVRPEQVLSDSRPGRSIVFAVDTRPCKGLYRLLNHADLAFMDGMFHPRHRDEAETKGHMTTEDAARVASRSGVRRAVLVHISPRYRGEEIQELAETASRRHTEAEMGSDGAVYSVPLSKTLP